MRNFVLLAFLITAVSLVSSSCAQVKQGSSTRSAYVQNKYACPKCDLVAAKQGKCTKCSRPTILARVKEVFGCSKCKTDSNKPGTCPKCKAQLKPMSMSYICERCPTTSSQAGNCNKCGKFRTKHLMTPMGSKP